MFSHILLIFGLLRQYNLDPVPPAELPEKLRIPMKSRSAEGTESSFIDLQPTKTYLANKNLPVWLVESETPSQLTPLEHVMEDVGPFTAYWNAKECSAALYFHKRKQFEGTIVNKYNIHGLTYDPISKTTDISRQTLIPMTLSRHSRRRFKNKRPTVIEAQPKQYVGFQSLGQYPDTVYIETLVIVDSDVTKILNSDYEAIVKHVLTLFNTADMLYSTVIMPLIKLNIAGIIISEKRDSLPKIQACHQIILAKADIKLSLNSLCAYDAIGATLTDFQLPLQSFDIVVFLTSMTLSQIPLVAGQKHYSGEVGDLLGQARFSVPPPNRHRESYEHTGIALIIDSGNMDCYPALAHEIAHLFAVPHDGGALWTEDGTCTASLMTTDTSTCKNCLAFGGETRRHFRRFFGGSLSCIFRNKPRSLEHPRGPRVDRETLEQCECYGFESDVNEQESPRNAACVPRSMLNCGSRLKCLRKDGRAIETTFYADGTPCVKNKEKVCWNKECLPIVHDD